MSRRHFQFFVVEESGKILKEVARACYSANAPFHASAILNKNPDAAAVFAVEKDGLSTYSAYRH